MYFQRKIISLFSNVLTHGCSYVQILYTTDCQSDGWDPQKDGGNWERDSTKSSAADQRAQPAIHQRHGEKPGQVPQRPEEQGGGVQEADPGVWGKVRSGARTQGGGSYNILIDFHDICTKQKSCCIKFLFYEAIRGQNLWLREILII